MPPTASWPSSNKTCSVDLHGRNALAVGGSLLATAFTAGALLALGISITASAGPFGSGPYGRVTFLSGKVTSHCSGLGPSGSLTPATLHRATPKGRPWPIGAGSASCLAPRLRVACVRPAPKSRSAVHSRSCTVPVGASLLAMNDDAVCLKSRGVFAPDRQQAGSYRCVAHKQKRPDMSGRFALRVRA